MEESYDEGLATHVDPESCAADREVVGEALTGAGVGRDIEPRKILRDADGVSMLEGNTQRVATVRRSGSRAVEDPRHAPKHLAREPGDLEPSRGEIASRDAL